MWIWSFKWKISTIQVWYWGSFLLCEETNLQLWNNFIRRACASLPGFLVRPFIWFFSLHLGLQYLSAEYMSCLYAETCFIPRRQLIKAWAVFMPKPVLFQEDRKTIDKSSSYSLRSNSVLWLRGRADVSVHLSSSKLFGDVNCRIGLPSMSGSLYMDMFWRASLLFWGLGEKRSGRNFNKPVNTALKFRSVFNISFQEITIH